MEHSRHPSAQIQLRDAVRTNDASEVQRLLLDPEFVPELDNASGPIEAASSNAASALAVLMADSRYSKTVTWFYALEAACRADAVDAFLVLFAHLPDSCSSLDDLVAKHKSHLVHAFCLSAQTCVGDTPLILPLFFDMLEPFDADIDRLKQVQSAFLDACSYGIVGSVRYLMNVARFAIDPSANDNVALRTACKKDRDGVVRMLLTDSRVNPSVGNKILLFEACKTSAVLVDALCSTGKLDLCEEFCDTFTPLSVAAAYGKGEIVKRILETPGFHISDDQAVQAVMNCIQNRDEETSEPFWIRFACFSNLLQSAPIREALLRKRRVIVAEEDVAATQRIVDVLNEVYEVSF